MASKYIQKFPIPGSFPDILHDFVREVLRDQPENIYEYGAAYFTALDEVSKYYSSLKTTLSCKPDVALYHIFQTFASSFFCLVS